MGWSVVGLIHELTYQVDRSVHELVGRWSPWSVGGLVGIVGRWYSDRLINHNRLLLPTEVVLCSQTV